MQKWTSVNVSTTHNSQHDKQHDSVWQLLLHVQNGLLAGAHRTYCTLLHLRCWALLQLANGAPFDPGEYRVPSPELPLAQICRRRLILTTRRRSHVTGSATYANASFANSFRGRRRKHSRISLNFDFYCNVGGCCGIL